MKKTVEIQSHTIRQAVVQLEGDSLAEHIEGEVDSVRLVIHFTPEGQRPVTRSLILPAHLFSTRKTW